MPAKPKTKRKKKPSKPAVKAAVADDPLVKRHAELLQRLDRNHQQLALVNGMLRTIITGAPIIDLFKIFASNLKTLVPFDRASISLVDYEREVFHIPFMIMGGRVQETKEAPRPFDETVLTQVVKDRTPLLRTDVRKTQSFGTDTDFIKKGFATEMIYPLEVGDKVFGTFQVGCFEAGRLKADHLDLLEAVIPAIAVAVYQHFSDTKFIFV